MTNSENSYSHSQSPIPPGVQQQLRAVLDQLPHTVPLYLFTKKGQNDVYNQAAKEIVRAFAGLGKNIQLHEMDLNHDLAQKWRVDISPTILFDPEH
jgi:hypothetical protein